MKYDKKLPFTIGIELETFLIDKEGKIQSARAYGFPHDGDNILVEFRGEPSRDVYQATYSVLAEFNKWKEKAYELGLSLAEYEDWYKKDENYLDLTQKVLRKYGWNKTINWRNLYGLLPSKKNITHHAAGLHVSIMDEQEFHYDGKLRMKYAKPLDFSYIFRKIEEEFLSEIEKSERTKGFYEMKPNGRIEYRSLPASCFDEDFAKRLYKKLTEEE